MTAEALLCRQYLGWARNDSRLMSGVEYISDHSIDFRDRNVYYWYYGSYAMFQFGGSLWKKWNEDMKAALLPTQRQEFDPQTKKPLDEDGSWDPIGEWGLAGGRVYSTALGAMTLEVYYRFVRATQGVGL